MKNEKQKRGSIKTIFFLLTIVTTLIVSSVITVLLKN